MAKDVYIFRHGTTNPQYDDNGRQIDSTVWEQTNQFTCVEVVQFYNAYRNFSKNTYETEQELHHKLFYVEVWRQDQQRNYDIVLGDYIYEPDLGYWWKILAVSQKEVMPGCYYLIIRGQRLTSREEYKLRIRDALTADESHTGR